MPTFISVIKDSFLVSLGIRDSINDCAIYSRLLYFSNSTNRKLILNSTNN